MASAALFTSCRDGETLLDKEAGHTVNESQILDEIKKFPEKSFLVTEGFEAGNNKYLIQTNTNGLSHHDDFGYMSILLGTEHMTNDFIMASSHWFNGYYMYLARNVENSRTRMIWRFYYKTIYNMNQVVEFIGDNPSTDDAKWLKARAIAMRGLAHLDLVRLYDYQGNGVPYRTEVHKSLARMPKEQVLKEIEKDLLKAYNDLASFRRANKQIIDKNVVAGFLARLYMTTGEHAKAADYALKAREGYVPMNSTQLEDGFSDISNPEWMWGADIDGATTGVYASFFSHIGSYNPGYAGLLNVFRLIDVRLYNQISNTDKRKEWWLSASQNKIPKYANTKFYDPTFFLGDYVFMRAAEFYFIEAEALARSGQEAKARQVLYDIMSTRDSSYTLSVKSGAELLNEININKRVELWGEGQNFYDMKRLGQDLVRNYPGSNHISIGRFNIPAGDKRLTFQVPQHELDVNTDISNP